MFLIFTFVTFLSFGQSDAVVGKTDTALGDYRIMESLPVEIEGQSFKTFKLLYEKSQNPIVIYIDDHDNCRDYIVRSRYVEIKYVCRKSGFGVEAVFGKHMKYDHVMNNFLMDPVNYKNQMRLSEGSRPEKEALELIATNFPKLLKNVSLLK